MHFSKKKYKYFLFKRESIEITLARKYEQEPIFIHMVQSSFCSILVNSQFRLLTTPPPPAPQFQWYIKCKTWPVQALKMKIQQSWNVTNQIPRNSPEICYKQVPP
jgi:hypothetical protein